MPRKPRESSGTGIYHVMMRGINRQDIFEEDEDYRAFIRIMVTIGDLKNTPCHIYAYCLMPNHVHLLIAEKNRTLGEVVKSIASSYALYFNKKYGRIGHLFQDRFKSEPCNDSGYFMTLFRYIHQNPVKAGLVLDAKDYQYSSWRNDYLGLALHKVCHTESAIKRFGMDELNAWVEMPLPEKIGCIDMDKRAIVADETVKELILEKGGLRMISDLSLYTKQRQKDIIRDVMRELEVGPRQMVRVSGMTYAVVHKLWTEI